MRVRGHCFTGDLDSYRIVVDPADFDGHGVDLTLTRSVPSFRPRSGYYGTPQHYLAWLSAVPEVEVRGTLEFMDLD